MITKNYILTKKRFRSLISSIKANLLILLQKSTNGFTKNVRYELTAPYKITAFIGFIW